MIEVWDSGLLDIVGLPALFAATKPGAERKKLAEMKNAKAAQNWLAAAHQQKQARSEENQLNVAWLKQLRMVRSATTCLEII